jgi:hypothetical protein
MAVEEIAVVDDTLGIVIEGEGLSGERTAAG